MPLSPLLALNFDFSLVLLPDGIGQGCVSRERSGRPAAPFLLLQGLQGGCGCLRVCGRSALEMGKEGFSLAPLRARAPGLSERSRRVGLPGKRRVEGSERVEAGPGPGKSDRSGAASFALAERLGSN